MMLKLRGHPPVLMKKQDSKSETQLSNMLSKVKILCILDYYNFSSVLEINFTCVATCLSQSDVIDFQEETC